MPLLIIILFVILLALFLYWQLVIAEGAYLGRRVVALLYDLVARRYNDIKQYMPETDAQYLSQPLTLSLQGIPQPWVLDVATGTSRLPLTLCEQPLFEGHIIALDNARRMLHEATEYVATYRDRITWVWHHAVPLPFDDQTFDLVTCLEALEFMPSTAHALQECVRVLKPGGLLLVTNRVGSGRRFMPGKTYRQERFEALLQSFGQIDVTTQAWQIDYDLVWSIKPALIKTSKVLAKHPRSETGWGETLRSLHPIDLLRCPHCCATLNRTREELTCQSCERRYPIGPDGVIELL
jgi:ubiquinone/menaquinone biosynthesis C-methylase UbiE